MSSGRVRPPRRHPFLLHMDSLVKSSRAVDVCSSFVLFFFLRWLLQRQSLRRQRLKGMRDEREKDRARKKRESKWQRFTHSLYLTFIFLMCATTIHYHLSLFLFTVNPGTPASSVIKWTSKTKDWLLSLFFLEEEGVGGSSSFNSFLTLNTWTTITKKSSIHYRKR